MFIRVYRLEIQVVMLVFSTQLCELLPFNLLSGSTVPPPSLRQSAVRGGGALSPVEDHILQEFNTLYLARFRTYKIAIPQTKT